MGKSVNKVILIGTLGRDPEMKYLPNGDAVCNFSMATDEGYKDKNTGQKVDKTEWHRIVAFRRLAEIMGEYLKKGSKIYVEGKLQTRDWEKDGVKRYTTEIVAKEMTMMSNPGSNQQAPQQAPQAGPSYQQAPQQAAQQGYGQAPQQSPQAPQQPRQPTPSNSFDDFDDDIPF